MLLNIMIVLVGCGLLYFGADWLVKGAGSLAAGLGISPMVIGMSIVAIGTSMPEIIVSILAAFKGQAMLAVGNVVGSNICNMALGVGIAACMYKITADKTIIRRNIPIMLAAFLIGLFFIQSGVITRLEGVLLLLLLFAYIGLNYYLSLKDKAADNQPGAIPITVKEHWKQVVLIIAGIAVLAGGARLVVDAASALMLTLGASERFVGLTIVALGTSLPELITSIVAAARKETAISLGNIIGSNVFNLFGALGLSAIFAPVILPESFFAKGGVWIDYLVMLIICILPMLLMWKSCTIFRKGGALLVGLYVIYVIWLLVTQTI